MNDIAGLLNRWSEGWASLLWSVVWQSTLVAGVVAAIAFLLRRASPSVRFWLWQIVAIKLLVMPLWSVSITLPKFFHRGATNAQPAPDPTGQGDLRGTTIPLRPEIRHGGEINELTQPRSWRIGEWLSQFRWQSGLFVAWLAGVFWQLVGVVRHRFRLSRLLGRASEVTDSQLAAIVAELAKRIDLRRLPRIVAVDLEGSPFVCGIWRPVLVLPHGILDGLDLAELRQVLLHELAHVKRRDLLWGWIPQVARMLYFFHPVAHWVSYRIRLERELACDQVAMAVSGLDAAGYASTLVRVVSQYSQPTALKAAAAGSLGLAGGSESFGGEKSSNSSNPKRLAAQTASTSRLQLPVPSDDHLQEEST